MSIRSFSQITADDVAFAGGKGASLGEMTQAGIAVPGGFVVGAECFESFLGMKIEVEKNDRRSEISDRPSFAKASEGALRAVIKNILASVDVDDMASIDAASREIQALMLAQEMDEGLKNEIVSAFDGLDARFVAVRSSATAEDSVSAAWAGQLDTFLNTTRDQLIDHVKKCWASLYTPRAIFYRFEKGLEDTDIGVAVVVQKMVQSDVSGIAFSVHPVTENYDHMVLEAGFGLGEAIVSGQVTPDTYVVSKSGGIVEKHVSVQRRKLTKAEIKTNPPTLGSSQARSELLRAGDDLRLMIEDFGKSNEDRKIRIEPASPEGSAVGGELNVWVDLDGDEGVVQKLSDEKIVALAEMVMLIERHYGFPVDVEWAFEDGQLYIVQARPITTLSPQSGAGSAFLTDGNEIQGQNQVSLIDALVQKYGIQPPFIHKGFHAKFFTIDFVQMLWNRWGEYSGYYYPLHISAFHDNYWDLYYLPHAFDELRKHYFFSVDAEKHYDDWLVSCDALRKQIEQFSEDLVSFDAYIKSYESLVDAYVFQYALSAPIQEACGLVPESWVFPEIQTFCDEYSVDFDEVMPILMAPVDHSFVIQEKMDLLDIAYEYYDGKDSLAYQNTIELHQKKWFWTENNYARIEERTIQSIDVLVKELQQRNRENVLQEKKLLASLPSTQKEKKESLFAKHPPTEKLRYFVQLVERFALMQDVRKAFVLELNHYHQLFLQRVAKKFSQSVNNLWYYGYAELMQAIKTGIWLTDDEKINRKQMMISVESKEQKTIFSGESAHYFFEQLQDVVDHTQELKGQIAQSGRVRGRVVLIRKSHDLVRVQEGDILVTSMTRPEMTAAMHKAAGFVTDEGGITSHAAIVSRELKKPCIIGTKIATQILNDGDIVEVDADNGVVHIVKNTEYHSGNSQLNNVEGSDLSGKFLQLIANKTLYPPLSNCSAFTQGSEYMRKKYFGKWYDEQLQLDVFFLMKEGFSQVWFSETDMKYLSAYVFQEYLSSPERFDKRIQCFEENKQHVWGLYEEYSYAKVQSSSWDVLLPLVERIRDLIWDANAAVFFSIYLDKAFCAEVLAEQKYPLSKEQLDAMWSDATEPGFASFDKTQLQQVLQMMQNDCPLIELVETCQYFFTDYFSAKSLKDVEEKLKTNFSQFFDNKNGIQKQLQEEQYALQHAEEKHDAFLASLRIEEKKIAQYVQLAMKLRDQRKNFFAQGLTIIYRIAEKMFDEVGLEKSLIPFYTIKELTLGRDYLKEHAADLQKRKKGFQLLIPYSGPVQKRSTAIDVGREQVNTYFLSGHENCLNSKSLNGQCGSSGRVQGKIRIVLDMPSADAFQAGDILVTGMTRPEFVPLMKKASAVITDEGGMTSHAAIISRELGIPCVIGTKIATQILNDGDIVEVDADNGVVYRVQKKEKFEWIKVVERQNCPLFLNFICSGITDQYTEKVLGHKLGYDFYVYLNGEVYITKEAQKQISERFDTVINEHGIAHLEHFLHRWYQSAIDLLEHSLRSKELLEADNKHIARHIGKITEEYFSLSSALMLVLEIERVLRDKIRDFLQLRNIPPADIEQYVYQLSAPEKKSESVHESEALTRIVNIIKEKNLLLEQPNAELERLIEEHLETFAWIGADRFFYDGWTREDVIERLRFRLRSEADEEAKKEPIDIDQLTLSSEEQYIIDIAREHVFFRTYRMDVFVKASYYLKDLLKEVAMRLDISLKALTYLLPQEIIDSLDAGQLCISKECIAERMDAYGFYAKKDKTKTFSGKAYTDFKAQYFSSLEVAEQSVITGMTAQKGMVRGVVKIVKEVADLDKVQRGDILVSPMTVQSFIAAMERAAAFVTDEGGITCHASVVAREFKKPCVIGTQVATKVLQDGDFVEVDANNGIVYIIEKKKNDVDTIKTYLKGDLFTLKSSLYPLTVDYGIHAWIQRTKERYADASPIHDVLIICKDEGNDGSATFSKEQYEQNARLLLTNDQLREQIFNDFEEDRQVFFRLVKDNNEWEELVEAYLNVYASGVMIDGFLQTSEALVKEIKRKYPNQHAAIDQLVQPSALHFIQEEELALRRIAQAGLSNDALERHQQQYFWMYHSYKKLDPLPVLFFEERCREYENDTKNNERISFLSEYAKKYQTFCEEIEKENIFEAEDFKTLRILSQVALIMDRRKACNLMGNVVIFDHVQDIAHKNNVDKEDVLYLLVDEFEQYKKGQLALQDIDIEKRKKAFAFVSLDGDYASLSGQEALQVEKEIIAEQIPLSSQKHSVLEGMSACRGRVTGKVCVINYAGEKDFPQDAVLVTSMTRPDFVPYMKDAIAIVTDEGGITSHAAIVSRELGKPCLIGTNVATAVLHDGDMVEVDADHGVVRIIEKNKRSTVVSEDNNLIEETQKEFEGISMISQQGSFCSLLYGGFLGGCFGKYWKQYYDFVYPPMLFLSKDNEGLLYFSGDDFARSTEVTWQQFQANGQLQQKEDLEKIWDQVNLIYDAYPPSRMDNLSEEEIRRHVETCFDYYHRIVAATLFPESLDKKQVGAYFASLPEDAKKDVDVAALYHHATRTQFDSFAVRMDEMVLKHRDDPYTLQYIFAGYNGIVSLADVCTEVEELIAHKGGVEAMRAELVLLKSDVEKNKKACAVYRTSLPKAITPLFDYIALCMHMRHFRRIPLNKVLVLIANAMQRLLQLCGIDASYYVYTSYDDLYKKLIDEDHYGDILEQRKQEGIISRYDASGVRYAAITDYAAQKKQVLAYLDEGKIHDDVVHGETGARGTARGKVQIILSEKDFHRFEAGNILVTSMTRPDFLPLMKKAAAIVTDEGSITCHAAIVSRELGVPCVIGTERATRVFVDGDVVEVDADRGVVKKVEETQKENYSDWEYEFQQRDDHPPFMTALWCQALQHYHEEELGFPIPSMEYIFTSEYKGYIKKDLKRTVLMRLEKQLEDNKYRTDLLERLRKRIEGLRERCIRLSKESYHSFSNKALADRFEDFYEYVLYFVPWYYIPWYIVEENMITDRIKTQLLPYQEKIEVHTDMQNALSILTAPRKAYKTQQEQEDFFHLLEAAKEHVEYKEHPVFLEAVDKYLTSYDWMPTFLFLDRPRLSKDVVLERVQEALETDQHNSIALSLQTKEKYEQLYQRLFPIIEDNKNLVEDINFIQELVWLMQIHVEDSFEQTAKVLPFFHTIAERLALSKEEWVYYTPKEISQALRGEIFLHKENLKKRKEGYMYKVKDGTVTFLQGISAQEEIRKIKEATEHVNERMDYFSGLAVSPGKITGRIHKAKNPEEAKKIQSGDILVCPMTSPDYLPAMKKSAAIITSEGGLLCHAAIVSRELGIPCVVGTKVAMQVLTDGDVVEVDANTGKVKKI